MIVVLLVLVAVVAAIVVAFTMGRRRTPLAARAVSIDSFTLGEPWRRHVAGAQSTQRRYLDIAKATAGGPLRERLDQIAVQVQRSVVECWEIAKRGDQLDTALGRLNTASLRTQLAGTDDEASRASLQSQIDSSDRIRSTRDDADRRLRVLNTQLGELVAQAAEVSVGADSTDQLGSAVTDVVTQLEALRLAFVDVDAADTGMHRPDDTGSAQATPAT
jgi:hypothetical protein